jgi:long-chain acyl-CoA synthetase
VSSEELSSHCAARLAPHKRPCHIEFRDALPTSTVGKILYRVLRDEELARAANGAETK